MPRRLPLVLAALCFPSLAAAHPLARPGWRSAQPAAATTTASPSEHVSEDMAPWTPASPPAPTTAAGTPAPATPPAAASPPPPPPPHLMRLNAAIDVPVMAIGAVLTFAPDLATRELRWAGCGACDPTLINGLDRRVIGNESVAAARASDALLYTAIAAPVFADLADALVTGRSAPGGKRRAAGGWARDVVVLTEVLLVNVGLTNVVKYAVRRPRPYSYDPDNALGDPTVEEARLSFYSGHASTAFAMMSAWATIFTLRHPRARAAVPVWLVAMGLAATTAILRVEAGKHFWTDVLAGSIAGTAVGVLVPTLHRSDLGRRWSAGLRPSPRGALVSLTGRF